MNLDVGMIIQAVGALGLVGFLGQLITARWQKRKISADAASVITQSAISLLEPMQKELKEMKDELEAAREDLKKLHVFTRQILKELSSYRELNSGELNILDGNSTS